MSGGLMSGGRMSGGRLSGGLKSYDRSCHRHSRVWQSNSTASYTSNTNKVRIILFQFMY